MTKNTREERLQIMLSPDELQLVDDFRFKYRLPSRAAAVRELLKRGLTTEDAMDGGGGRQSREFGVFSRGPAGHREADE